jgi:acyl-coenzyme A synthetase/AMP-(fatty) acid ligase
MSIDRAAVAAVDDRATAVLLYTSGTTADPKGVVPHGNLDAEREAAFTPSRHRKDALACCCSFMRSRKWRTCRCHWPSVRAWFF